MGSSPASLLATLPASRIVALGQAHSDLRQANAAFNARGGHPVRDALAAGLQPFTRHEHYPQSDVDDVSGGYAWYYHAHEPSDMRPWEEHGHFHCWAYPQHFADAQVIARPPDGSPPREAGVTHLLGLCCSDRGTPNRLFTINRWASNEWMYPADDLLRVIDRFTLADALPHAETSRWLSALLRVLSPQIEALLRERDMVLAEARARDPEGYTEDRSLDIVSTVTFDLKAHLQAVSDRVATLEPAAMA